MVGRILRSIRRKKNLKQNDIADKLHVATNTISNYETEASNISFETAVKYIHECNFDIQLIDKEDNKVYKIEQFDTINKKC